MRLNLFRESNVVVGCHWLTASICMKRWRFAVNATQVRFKTARKMLVCSALPRMHGLFLDPTQDIVVVSLRSESFRYFFNMWKPSVFIDGDLRERKIDQTCKNIQRP